MSTVEKYIRRGCRPITLLTDVSKAFDRVHLELYRRKLFDFGLPRQLQELILEFLSGLRIRLCWGKVKTQLLDRGNIGTPQGCLEGMWNFGVYSDNISTAIAQAVPGIEVGGVIVREVAYADDITPINPNIEHLIKALKAIFSAGGTNAFKYNLDKCKIIGLSAKDNFDAGIDVSDIKRVESGILLGAVVKWDGLDKSEHVKRRAGMVKSAIGNIKGWRTRGLPFSIAYRQIGDCESCPALCLCFFSIASFRMGR